MRIIQEYKKANEIGFEIKYFNDKKLVFTEDISHSSVTYEEEGKTYLLLYDSNMNPIHEVFCFLNDEILKQSINSRIKSMNALKLLYNYQAIIGKDLRYYGSIEFKNLKQFLKGVPLGGSEVEYKFATTRSSQTINEYFSVYRQFYDHLGLDNRILKQKIRINYNKVDRDTARTYGSDKYAINEKIPKKPIEIPEYISVNEFKKIINYTRINGLLMEEIVIRLMFQCGLRIGEVLGLTSDDLTFEKAEGEYAYIAYIRNRVSDMKYQHAKTCMKVSDRIQYRSKDYLEKGNGWQYVVVPQDLYEKIDKYIENAHTKARDIKHSNYFKYVVADRVRQPEPYEEDNFYIFINNWGRTVSQTLWNERIKEILTNCDIHIDKFVREHNLNHRFRHGFAMYHVQYHNTRILELADLMRHGDINSALIYYTPTVSDQIKIKTNYEKDLYKIIPELGK